MNKQYHTSGIDGKKYEVHDIVGDICPECNEESERRHINRYTIFINEHHMICANNHRWIKRVSRQMLPTDFTPDPDLDDPE